MASNWDQDEGGGGGDRYTPRGGERRHSRRRGWKGEAEWRAWREGKGTSGYWREGKREGRQRRMGLTDDRQRHLLENESTKECPFYYKIGVCRHGNMCSRQHIKPVFIFNFKHIFVLI